MNYRIFHLEDDTEEFRWFPKSLYYHFLRTFPDWEAGEFLETNEPGDNEWSVEFSFKAPNRVVNVQYKAFRTTKLFEANYQPQPGDVLLLDIMGPNEDGELAPVGLDLFRKYFRAKGVIIFVVTAYDHRFKEWVNSEGDLPPEAKDRLINYLIAKPMDTVAFCARIVSNFTGIHNAS